MKATEIKFRVNLGEETRPIIENIIFPIENNKSLFNEQYIKVFEEIENYLAPRPKENDERFNIKQNEQINNIMAFVGERGSGKTSCMLSVANALEYKSQNSFGEYSQIAHTCFHSIDLIDPSFFDEKCNVLNIIIAKLFRKFKKKEDKVHCSDKSRFDKKQNLVEMFQRVQASLNCIIGGKQHSEDDLEQLIDLSASVNLCDDIQDLVDSYLEYMYTKKDVLIIMVDDIDLNTQHAHIMAEQIRKYFIHPNVIILLAVKIDQLANVMKRQYTEEFKCLLGKQMTLESIDEMVDRYLNKLIPHPQRIFLPDLETFFEMPLTIEYRNDRNEDAKREFATIREAVPMLIFEKTRYLFYNSLGTTSYIIPRNLRELRHIIELLWNMKTYEKENKVEYNKLLFRKYFYETWTSNNLDVQGRELIKNLLEITDAVLINKSVIGLLKKRFGDQMMELIQAESPELKLILRDDNVTYNISVGDVMGFIYHLENITEKVEDQKLLFMIKSIYSIRLYEYYDQITERQPNEVNLMKEVLRNDFLKKISNYQKMVGGNFINSVITNLLPESSSTGSRNRRIINLDLFYDLLSHVLRDTNSFEASGGNSVDYNIAMNLVEFFALTISMYEDQKAKISRYRNDQDIYYRKDLSSQKFKNLYFDITAFTYNLIFIKDAYSRFDENLYEKCKEHPESLLNKISNYTTSNRYPDDKEHSWMSFICIRNAEVLQDFVLYLEDNRPKGASSFEVIKNFFESASKFQILSYDFDEDGEDHYDINFSFLSEIASILKNINPDLFESIFTNSKDTDEESNLPGNVNLNIRLNLRGKYYQKDKLWERLVEKNKYLSTMPNYREIFDRLFDKKHEHRYPKENINNLLNQYKQQVESF